MPLIRYWIAKGAISGANYVDAASKRCTKTWDSTPEAPGEISTVETTSLNDKLKPFQLLQHLLRTLQQRENAMRTTSQNEELFNSDSKDLSELNKRKLNQHVDTELDSHVTELQTPKFAEEFIAYAEREVNGSLVQLQTSCAQVSSSTTDKSSERFVALMTLSKKLFQQLALGEFLENICEAFGDSIWHIKEEYHSLLLKTKRVSTDVAIESNTFQFIYDIPCIQGHSRANLIDHFFFPEQLTNFLMTKYHLSYAAATGILYSTGKPANTVYHSHLH